MTFVPPMISMFQSTPPAEARGDFWIPRATLADLRFNPLPPPKRGETLVPVWELVFWAVSIHSPRRSEGRRRCSARSDRRASFQSTPPAEARGDSMERNTAEAISSFNPLPPPKRGETKKNPLRQAQGIRVSIHSPRRSEGRLGDRLRAERRLRVSIHSPRRSEGRRRGPTDATRVPRFNPLPPPKRGETVTTALGMRATPEFQSTPPAEARGDVVAGLSAFINKFQSTPPAEARGDSGRSCARPSSKCFNPLPPPKRGETMSIRMDLYAP